MSNEQTPEPTPDNETQEMLKAQYRAFDAMLRSTLTKSIHTTDALGSLAASQELALKAAATPEEPE